MIATGLDGVAVYANPACAELLGYESPANLTGQSLPDLLVGDADTPPHYCVSLLRAARNSLRKWRHAEGYHISALVTGSILQRATDPLLLVSISDITEYRWNTDVQSDRPYARGRG
jgi:PAS domain S-box-containing protein